MRILHNDNSTITMMAVDEEDAGILDVIASNTEQGQKLEYGGRSADPVDPERFCRVHLYVGGNMEKVTEVDGNCSTTSTENVGGHEVILCGSSVEDKRNVGRMRDSIFFGAGGMIFLGETQVEGQFALVFTLARCKHCQGSMTTMAECEWNTCNACAEKCDHAYERGVIHGPVDIGMGEFCGKCGRCKPNDDPSKTKAVQVEQETGILVVDNNTGLSANQVAQAIEEIKGADCKTRSEWGVDL